MIFGLAPNIHAGRERNRTSDAGMFNPLVGAATFGAQMERGHRRTAVRRCVALIVEGRMSDLASYIADSYVFRAQPLPCLAVNAQCPRLTAMRY